MSELPILFKGPMTRAIVEDRKTQTRRLAKPQPPADFGGKSELYALAEHAPYAVGDHLWVRETWKLYDCFGKIDPNRAIYAADFANDFKTQGSWRPSIFMPKWASRLWLEVKTVRAERLQDISEDDAIAEGIYEQLRTPEPFNGWKQGGPCYESPRTAYSYLWDSIQAKPKPVYYHPDLKKPRIIRHYVSYPWDDVQETRTLRGKPWYVIGNPFVFAYEFKRVR
jgi:hypothetical protein